MTRISLYTTEYPPFHGGVANFISQYVHCVDKHIQSIVVFENQHIKRSDGRCTTLQPTRWIWPRWIPVLFHALRERGRTDLFVFSSVLPLGTIGLLLSLFFNVRYQVFTYGMDLLQQRPGSWKFLLTKKVLHKSADIVAISSYTAELLSRYQVEMKKIKVIHPAAYYTPGRFNSKKPSGISSEDEQKKLIVSVGRLVQRKNISLVIKLAALYKQNPDILFCIVGDGPEKDRLHLQARGLTNVRFLGAADSEEITWVYQHATLVLFVPKDGEHGDKEGFGIAAIEASAFSKPVIATRTGGVPDAVSHMESGVLIPPDDIDALRTACKTLLADSSLQNKLSSQGFFRYTESFSSSAQCKKFHELISKKTVPVAVVIPAYNAETTIRACLDSLQQQSVLPNEIVVVNDGSTDKTESIVKTHFPEIKIIFQENTGAPAARNKGVKNTASPYLLFVDADMVCRPDMIERSYELLSKNPSISFTYSSFTFGWKKFTALPFSPQKLAQHNYIHTSSLVRRSIFPGFDIHLRRHQDWDLWLTIVARGGIGKPIKDVLYSISPQKKRISRWVPSFAYKLPYGELLFPELKKYRKSEAIIRKKHGI